MAERKLIPALSNLACKGRVSSGLRILGVARTEQTDAQFRESLREGVMALGVDAPSAAEWNEFSARVFYTRGDVASPESLKVLSFKYKVGAEIPQSKWATYSLWE